MMTPEEGGIWRPTDEGELDLTNPQQLSFAILNIALLSEEERARVVGHLAMVGQYYQAARCLEIVAQHRLGLDFTGSELIDYYVPGFGGFHAMIYDLLRSGLLYHKAKRPSTGIAAYRRALLFVEEALRSMKRYQKDDQEAVWGIGLAFELAGHCCAAMDDSNGLEYYQAAETYWGKAVRLRPEEIMHWTYHPVTQTVINCLNPVVETRSLSEDYRDQLLTSDYQTRLESAKSLLR
jgi:tetratricopeptide (TPR) repeat protein